MVGLDRIELSTSPLSGVRSSQLSYRPTFKRLCRTTRGNAAELRPAALAAQARAASIWWSWSGSNRRPPECKSGALPAELQPQKCNRGQLDAEITGPAHDRFRKTVDLRVEIRNVLTSPPCGFLAVWSGTAVSYSPALYTQTHFGFPKLHPRSLLERR